MRRLLVGFVALVLVAGCARSRDVQKDLKIVDVRTGWYDAGIVEGNKNKIVPAIALKLQNVSQDAINKVQINAIFRRVNENEGWGEKFVFGIGADQLAPGAKGKELVLPSTLGYTGEQSRSDMLRNAQFVDAKVEVFGKHGSNNWTKMGEFPIERKLLTDQTTAATTSTTPR